MGASDLVTEVSGGAFIVGNLAPAVTVGTTAAGVVARFGDNTEAFTVAVTAAGTVTSAAIGAGGAVTVTAAPAGTATFRTSGGRASTVSVSAAGVTSAGVPVKDLVYAVSGGGTSGANASDLIVTVTGGGTADAFLTVTLGPDVQGLEPYKTQTVTATIVGTVATLVIEQFLGPDVLLSGTGPVWTYTTPGSVLDGPQLMFRVTATPTVGAAASAEVTHFVYPNTFGYYTDAGQMASAFATATGT